MPILGSSNEAVKIDGNHAAENPACTLKTHPRYLGPIFIAVSGFVQSFWKTQCMLLIEIGLLFLPSKCQTKGNGNKREAECFCKTCH